MVDDVAQLYIDGATVEELCEKYGKKRGTIYQWLRVAGGSEAVDKQAKYQKERRKKAKDITDKKVEEVEQYASVEPVVMKSVPKAKAKAAAKKVSTETAMDNILDNALARYK